MFKKIIFFLIVVSALNSCGEDQTVLFEMEFDADFTIYPPINTIETFYYNVPNVNTFYSSYSGNIDDALVGSINSFSCSLNGKFGAIDYNFIEEMYIYGIDPANPSDRRELFYIEFNPLDNENDLELFASLSDHKDILQQDLMHLQVRVNFRNTIGSELAHRISMRFQAFEE